MEGVAFPTGWPELAAACARGLADLAALQVPATGPDGEELRVPGGRSALVPDPAGPGRPADLAVRAALPARAWPPPPCSRSPRPRRRRPARSRSPSPARSCTRCGTASWRTSGRCRTAATTARWTPPRCSSSCSARTSSRPATRPWPAAWSRTPARRSAGCSTTAGSTSRGYLVYRADQGGLANQNWKDSPGAICSADGTRRERPGDGGGRPGLRVRRAAPHGVAGAHGVAGRDVRGAAGTGGRRSARPFPAGLLDAGALLPRARAGRRGPPGRRARLGRRASAVVGAAGQGVRRGRRPAAAGAGLLLRAGACAPWPRGSRRTTRCRTTAVRSGRTTTR